ncbi:hypothetical protein GCM10011396_38740 [Undibacterium terreum]|uniref:Uncharacterized protein n=1 Tax=Undibacterium terreum TaxID=1224302 RepID=A0A916UUL2_9BURK|nr:hypothetical protein GCM10011396_38740 [Undibacterium terreum]
MITMAAVLNSLIFAVVSAYAKFMNLTGSLTHCGTIREQKEKAPGQLSAGAIKSDIKSLQGE